MLSSTFLMPLVVAMAGSWGHFHYEVIGMTMAAGTVLLLASLSLTKGRLQKTTFRKE